jgi:hypothetical protein
VYVPQYVGIATGYALEVPDSIPNRCKILLFFKASRPIPGFTKPPIEWILGVLSPGGKAAGT